MTLFQKKNVPATPLPESTLGTLIHEEQISMLYRQLPTSVAGNMAGAWMLASVLLGERPL
jgi:hypothetical protein